ncbi:MAG: hypothetical protein JSW33_02175 [bacterium]|nr:MAG: hypothetical protein JSW33_02175 [bacterium]
MIPFGLIILDHEFNILSCNSEVLRMLGLNEKDDPSGQMQNFLSEQEEYQAFLHDLEMKVVPSQQAILSIKSPAGVIRAIRFQVTKSAGTKGKEQYYFFLSTDDTKDWQEIHLNRSLKFNSINKIGPSVAHEIRNPMSTIAIQRQILENSLQSISLDPENENRILKSLRILNTEIDRVSKLMEQFFKLVRSGSKEPTYEDVNSILREIYELVKQYCYENGVEIRLELEKDVPFVHIKRDKFIQVLLNLIINAVESIPEKGLLRIISLKKEDKSVIKIQDSGTGIPAAERSRIFTYYYSTKKDGGGVSLALAQQIIKEMRGRLFFESAEEKGVTFTIEVPKVAKF